jgi:hypothetical protein
MDKPAANSDGSVDTYFGPDAPKGPGKNWLRTVAGKGFFVNPTLAIRPVRHLIVRP